MGRVIKALKFFSSYGSYYSGLYLNSKLSQTSLWNFLYLITAISIMIWQIIEVIHSVNERRDFNI